MAQCTYTSDNAKVHASRSSMKKLERVKTINTLPYLEWQLREARELCIHSAHADMITKWLLEKLKSDPEFRSSREAWDTLLSAFRLASPRRLASLLSAQDFLAACETAIAVEDPKMNKTNGPVVLAIHRIFEYLTQVCAGPEGMQLTAVLSVSASEAASFLGAWVASTLTTLGISMFENDMAYNLLQPGLEIWDRRKKSLDMNEAFAKHCLVPISRLLPVLNHYEKTQKRKRRAYGVISPPLNYASTIESLLAKHAFTPARSAFFKILDANGYHLKSQKEVGSQDPAFTLRTMLTALREDGTDQGQLMVLPHLFDIVVRSTPAGNHNQRTREKLWWDATFEALVSCASGPDDSPYVLQAIEDMLSVVQRTHATLSKSVLDHLIERHSGLANGKGIAWKLISQVLQIDSDVFADDEHSTTLLSAITSAAINAEQMADRKLERWRGPIAAESPGREFLIKFLQAQIAAPLMRAFADRKKMGNFIDLCAAQIKSSAAVPDSFIPSLWTDLGYGFAPLLENSLNPGQFIKLFDHYWYTLRTNNEMAEASVVILDALLSGVKSETVTDTLHERCGALMQTLLGFALSTGAVNQRPTWTLMERTFKIWFPSWRNAQSDLAAVIDMALHILNSLAFNAAKLQGTDGPLSYVALSFIARVCSQLYQYGGTETGSPRDLCYSAMKIIVDKRDFKRKLKLLLRHPDLLADLMTNDLVNLVQESIADRAQVEAPEYLMTIIFQLRATQQMNHLLGLLVQYLSPGPSDEPRHEISDESATLEALNRLSVANIPRTLREQIVDAICHQQVSDGAGSNHVLRFAVLVKFMKHGIATSQLASDPQVLWYLAKSSAADMEGPTARSLEELSHLIIEHLLNTQDSERSQSMLFQFSEDVKLWMNDISANQRIDSTNNTVHVATKLITGLEKVKSNLPHREPGTISPFVKTCFRLATDSDEDPGDTTARLALKVLLSLPDSTYDSGGLEGLIDSAMSRVTAPAQDASSQRLELATKMSKPIQALDLFDSHLTPSQRERVLGLSTVVPLDIILEDVRKENGSLGLPLLARRLDKGRLDDEDVVTEVLPILVRRAVQTGSIMIRKQVLTCIASALKSTRMKQHSIETAMAGVKEILDDFARAKGVYLEVCQVLDALLKHHRAQLRGRHHLIVPIFQSLLSSLFESNDSNNITKRKALMAKHAKAAGELLSLFAEPPQSIRTADSSSLVDEARQEQARVGKSVQYIVHHYCHQTLEGMMGPGVKDAITPGIWSLITAMESGEANGVQSLSSAMDNSDRAVLRGVVEDWRRFGKWRGA